MGDLYHPAEPAHKKSGENMHHLHSCYGIAICKAVFHSATKVCATGTVLGNKYQVTNLLRERRYFAYPSIGVFTHFLQFVVAV